MIPQLSTLTVQCHKASALLDLTPVVLKAAFRGTLRVCRPHTAREGEGDRSNASVTFRCASCVLALACGQGYLQPLRRWKSALPSSSCLNFNAASPVLSSRGRSGGCHEWGTVCRSPHGGRRWEAHSSIEGAGLGFSEQNDMRRICAPPPGLRYPAH